MSVGPIENHRESETGALVFPVYSRRAGGLSVGINPFPGRKCCSFNCIYCQIFPFSTGIEFSLDEMKVDLRSAIADAKEQGIPVKGICFSGNGEPTLCKDFPQAIERAGRIRSEMVPKADLILISNGTGLLDKDMFSFLQNAACGPLALDIWLKLDAGTEQWFKKMSRSDISFEKIKEKIEEFIACTPVTIQTMLCAVEGFGPPHEEAIAWEKLLVELAKSGNVRKVQLYSKARPSPEDPKATALPIVYLEERAKSLRAALEKRKEKLGNSNVDLVKTALPPVEVYQ